MGRLTEEALAVLGHLTQLRSRVVQRAQFSVLIGQGDEQAEARGITRSSAGVLALKEKLSGSIVAIGNAPSALLTLCDLMEAGEVLPELVIGAPVDTNISEPFFSTISLKNWLISMFSP